MDFQKYCESFIESVEQLGYETKHYTYDSICITIKGKKHLVEFFQNSSSYICVFSNRYKYFAKSSEPIECAKTVISLIEEG